jgi:hypothetical protein
MLWSWRHGWKENDNGWNGSQKMKCEGDLCSTLIQFVFSKKNSRAFLNQLMNTQRSKQHHAPWRKLIFHTMYINKSMKQGHSWKC